MSDDKAYEIHRDASGEVFDRFGRPIQVGDVVMLPGKGDVAWKVQALVPMIDLRLPPGLIQVQLAAVMILGVKKMRPDPDLIKIRDKAEVQEARLAQAPAEGGVS